MMSVNRRHSIFGDYILVNKKGSPADVSADVLSEVKDYNALWVQYAREVASTWGASPTEKGFAEWLNKITKEASNGE